jgi:hypothetical protein
MTQRFPYAIDKWYLPVILPFGLKPKTDGVLLTDDGGFVATFGFFTMATPLAVTVRDLDGLVSALDPGQPETSSA